MHVHAGLERVMSDYGNTPSRTPAATHVPAQVPRMLADQQTQCLSVPQRRKHLCGFGKILAEKFVHQKTTRGHLNAACHVAYDRSGRYIVSGGDDYKLQARSSWPLSFSV